MAEEFDSNNIKKIEASARDSRDIIDEMSRNIKEFNKQTSSGARIGATLFKEFKGIAKV